MTDWLLFVITHNEKIEGTTQPCENKLILWASEQGVKICLPSEDAISYLKCSAHAALLKGTRNSMAKRTNHIHTNKRRKQPNEEMHSSLFLPVITIALEFVRFKKRKGGEKKSRTKSSREWDGWKNRGANKSNCLSYSGSAMHKNYNSVLHIIKSESINVLVFTSGDRV